MDVPDDKTWTWDPMIESAAEVASKAGVTFGIASLVGSDACSAHICVRTARSSSPPDGLGFDVAEAQAWYDLMVKAQKAKAIGSPEQISEEVGQAAGPERDRGRNSRDAGLQLQSAGGGQRCGRGKLMKMLRFPSLTGKATDRKTWYKASMLWSASAKTKNPDAAIAWINWFANDPAPLTSTRPSGASRQHRDPGRGQAQAVPGATGGREVHHRHQARAGRTPIAPPPAAASGRGLVPSRDGCPLRAGEHG